jgi:hypothetical protein
MQIKFLASVNQRFCFYRFFHKYMNCERSKYRQLLLFGFILYAAHRDTELFHIDLDMLTIFFVNHINDFAGYAGAQRVHHV